MRTLTVTNWERWQSYRSDRGQPPWIKVHRTVLRNPEWTMLTDAQRGQLVQIWILAADKGGVIEVPDSVNIVAFIQSVCCMKSEPDLQALVSHRFISLDAKVTPIRRQGDANVTTAMSAQSRVEKSSTEAEQSSSARAVCENCGNSWPAEYGTKCHECNHSPAVEKPDQPEIKACTCGEHYHQSYAFRCVDCQGKPSEAQRDSRRLDG